MPLQHIRSCLIGSHFSHLRPVRRCPFVKGFTHDLFLETGVLLVSVKLILNTYQVEVHARRLEERIDDVLSLMRTLAHEHSGQFRLPN